MGSALSTIGWIDWALLAVLVVSVGVGLVRGFVFEVMSLAGWVVAWFVAQWFAPQAAPLIPIGVAGSALNHAAAFAICFLAVILAWSLLARLLRMLVRATPVSTVDRALGAGFGLLRGAVLLLALTTVVTLTPAAQSADWRSSHGVLWLNTALQGLKPLLPAQAVKLLPD